MASPFCQSLRSQALTPVGSVLTLLPYIQKTLSLLSKHIQNLTIFPLHCYQASHHHPSFRLVILLTGPCFSPCPLSVCASHNSRMNKKGHLPVAVRWHFPPYISDFIPTAPHLTWDSSCSWTTPDLAPPLGTCTFCSLSQNALTPISMLYSPLLCPSSHVTFLRDILQINLNDNYPIPHMACHPVPLYYPPEYIPSYIIL